MMRMKVMILVFVVTTFCPPLIAFSIQSHNLSETYQPNQQLGRNEESINEQSDNVRHIIAAEQKFLERDAGKQIKKEKAIVTIEDDRFPTLEELRAKCQHFSRLFELSPPENYGDSTRHFISSTTSRPISEVARRPVFIRNKPTFIEKVSGGFYVTATPLVNEISSTKKTYWISSTPYPRVVYNQEQSTRAPSTTTTTKQTTTTQKLDNLETTTSAKSKIKIKFTKFEPVILQKTILTDGRVMYHWHRSLPTAPVDLLAPIVSPIVPPLNEYSPAQRNLDSSKLIESSSTTTTEKSSWLFVPFSNLFGGSHEEQTTSVETSTAPATTNKMIEESSTQSFRSVSRHHTEYQNPQLKLVVPIQYGDVDSAISAENEEKLNQKTLLQRTVPTSLQVVQVPQNVPRYNLGYTGNGYGFPAYNSYGPEFMNYQTYGNGPLDRQDKKLDDVTV